MAEGVGKRAVCQRGHTTLRHFECDACYALARDSYKRESPATVALRGLDEAEALVARMAEAARALVFAHEDPEDIERIETELVRKLDEVREALS